MAAAASAVSELSEQLTKITITETEAIDKTGGNEQVNKSTTSGVTPSTPRASTTAKSSAQSQKSRNKRNGKKKSSQDSTTGQKEGADSMEVESATAAKTDSEMTQIISTTEKSTAELRLIAQAPELTPSQQKEQLIEHTKAVERFLEKTNIEVGEIGKLVTNKIAKIFNFLKEKFTALKDINRQILAKKSKLGSGHGRRSGGNRQSDQASINIQKEIAGLNEELEKKMNEIRRFRLIAFSSGSVASAHSTTNSTPNALFESVEKQTLTIIKTIERNKAMGWLEGLDLKNYPDVDPESLFIDGEEESVGTKIYIDSMMEIFKQSEETVWELKKRISVLKKEWNDDLRDPKVDPEVGDIELETIVLTDTDAALEEFTLRRLGMLGPGGPSDLLFGDSGTSSGNSGGNSSGRNSSGTPSTTQNGAKTNSQTRILSANNPADIEHILQNLKANGGSIGSGMKGANGIGNGMGGPPITMGGPNTNPGMNPNMNMQSIGLGVGFNAFANFSETAGRAVRRMMPGAGRDK